jgi:hypothetical protein
VFAATAKATNVDPNFFRVWYSRYSEVPMAISDGDLQAIQRIWEIGHEMGLVKNVPKAKDLVWKDAVRE